MGNERNAYQGKTTEKMTIVFFFFVLCQQSLIFPIENWIEMKKSNSYKSAGLVTVKQNIHYVLYSHFQSKKLEKTSILDINKRRKKRNHIQTRNFVQLKFIFWIDDIIIFIKITKYKRCE